jgi:hypothetical protein
MYAKCKSFRAVAVAFHVSHESARTWVRGDGRADEVAVKDGGTGSGFRMDGRSLGRVALWTRSIQCGQIGHSRGGRARVGHVAEFREYTRTAGPRARG